MRILITNDDGIQAEGLPPLVRWAQTLGEVVVAAPKTEQSAKSHGIQLHYPIEVKPVDRFPGAEAFAVDSTPADCVRFAVLGRKQKFDLVLSGINRGLNIGTDIMYSGTVAAVFEAGNLGLRAMAVSTPPEYYPQAVKHMDEIWEYFQREALFGKNPIYNVNIPQGGGPFRITRQGGSYYSDEFVPVGEDAYRPSGVCVYRSRDDDRLDTDAVMQGYTAVMPLTLDRTDLAVYQSLIK